MSLFSNQQLAASIPSVFTVQENVCSGILIAQRRQAIFKALLMILRVFSLYTSI